MLYEHEKALAQCAVDAERMRTLLAMTEYQRECYLKMGKTMKTIKAIATVMTKNPESARYRFSMRDLRDLA
jgi:hypothetical protein